MLTNLEIEVEVHYDTTLPEPDVGWPGSLDIYLVTLRGQEIMHLLSESEIEGLLIAVECSHDD